MRVLFTSTEGLGHINPMTPLARAFATLGADVRWAAPAEAASAIERAGIAFHAAGGPASTTIAELVAKDPAIAALPPEERPNLVFARVFGGERVGAMLDDLVPLIGEWPPDVVIRDAAELAAPIAAALVGAPCHTHAFGALIPAHRLVLAGETVVPFWRRHGLEPRPHAGSYDAAYLDIYPPMLQEQDRPHVPETLFLRPADVTQPTTDGAAFVYVTFGTIFNNPAALRDVVLAVAAADVPVLVTVGPRADPSALGAVPASVRVEQYVPQAEVLPQAAAVVSHGGSGTFLAALAHGRPQLVLAQGADQYLNAAALRRSNAGIALPANAPAEEITAATKRLLAEPEFAKAAAEVARDIAAMPSATDVAQLLLSRYG